MDLIVDLYFITDIVVNFRTGHQDVDGAMEMRCGKIAKNYASSWLLIDVVSCIPVQYIVQAMDAYNHDVRGDSARVAIWRPHSRHVFTRNTAGTGTERGNASTQIKGVKILRLLRLTKLCEKNDEFCIENEKSGI